jgi:hypothetical protein
MMLHKINKIKSLLPDAQQTSMFEYFKSLRRKAVPTKNVVLVQCVEDSYYFGLFGQIVSSLREKQSVRVEQYVVRCLNVGESKSILTFFKARWIVNPLLNFVWERLFSSFCDRVAFRSTTLFPVRDTVDFYRAWKIWRGLTDKDTLINLQLDGVIAGDLINDSYLRYKPAPAVDLKDKYLLILLWQSLRYARRSRAYFSRVRPRLFLTSYSTYIHHGIPVRIAMQYGVRVFSFGNYQEFSKELSITDWVHTKNPDNYAADFFKLDNQDNKLAMAENALSTRLSGGVDNATAYMKKSAYAESGERVPDVNGAVVVFLHDFYDSPNVYREMLFPDFWDWICFTIESLTAANISFFVKPHPNQIHLSGAVLDDLKKRYPNLSMISTGVTNKQLAEAGVSRAVTVYGTVAHEMAYLGIPSVACARHPHINFEFCKTAFSKDEYASMLLDSNLSGLDKEAMRRQSLIFYYMHNLELTSEDQILINALGAFRAACASFDDQKDLVKMLQGMSKLAGYEAQISKMIC